MSQSHDSQFFITTAIDYPNGDPHLGHAYEKVVTDCYARWHRLLGVRTHYLTGTDENGQKLSKAAEQAGLSTRSYVDANVAKFRELCHSLQITNDDFIRTTEARHERVVGEIWRRLDKAGDIYLDRYQGHYCLACETFYPESQVKDKKCPVHDVPLTFTEEDGYFFRLSKYQEWITAHIAHNPQFLFPTNIRSELLSRLRGDKVLDLSISRPNQGWGIAVPGDAKHVIYTWFDALINYYTASVYDQNDVNVEKSKWWPAQVHVIGKDIAWFHAVIWPAMLKSAGLELPEQVYVHGMVLGHDGRRMSKTAGNGVDPKECLAEFSVDAFRYYLLRAIPSGQDGAFVKGELIRFHNSDLANEYGNLLMRVIKLSIGQLGQAVEASPSPDFKLEIFGQVERAMAGREHHLALAEIWTGVRRLNAYINQEEPWKKKADKEAFHRVMYTALLNLNHISVLLLPFIPESAAKALKYLGYQGDSASAIALKQNSFNLTDAVALFPRIETA